MTNQSVSDSEQVVQIAGNVEITNRYGLAVHEVRELAQLFMRENFPILRAEAVAAAEANVQQFLRGFEDKLAQNLGRVSLAKFEDPDIQSSLNDAVIAVAKKGDRSNSELLNELLIERISAKTDDYVSLVAGEAIKVVPRLTSLQIGFLTLVLFLRHTYVGQAKSFHDLIPLAKAVLELSQDSFGLSTSQKSHLEFVGCVSILEILTNSAYAIWKTSYNFLTKVPDDELKATIARDFPILDELAKAFEQNQIGKVTLTSVGQIIGLANLSKRIQGLQYANWLN